jgi:hypothetical protein
MSDLSRMLDDLYTLPEEDTFAPAEDTFLPEDTFTPEDAPTRAPVWASTEALDEAFASWVPGEPDGASALERSMLAEPEDEDEDETEPVPVHDDVEQWLVESEPVLELVSAVMAGWSPSDDDILPARRRGGRGRHSRRP